MTRVHQFHPVLGPGDAMSNHVFALQRRLRDWGYQAHAYAIEAKVGTDEVLPYRRLFREVAPEDLVLLHFSMGNEVFTQLAKLRALAGSGARATVVLEADTFPDTPTDKLIATLPGATDEVVIVNTHTDGPNATEENGALGILALAKYFAKMPKSERMRTMVFPLTTGHFAGPWVPSIRGVIEKHPDVIKRAVAAVTVEHLGCREWMDDASMHYAATGKKRVERRDHARQGDGEGAGRRAARKPGSRGGGESGQRRLAR